MKTVLVTIRVSLFDKTKYRGVGDAELELRMPPSQIESAGKFIIKSCAEALLYGALATPEYQEYVDSNTDSNNS